MLLKMSLKKNLSQHCAASPSTHIHSHRETKTASQFKLVYGFMVLAVCLATHAAACSCFGKLLFIIFGDDTKNAKRR